MDFNPSYSINDIALIFEGGGMRASFSSGIVNTLLQNKIYFNYVAGISAGSSLSVNYLSQDIDRTKRSFVDIVNCKEFSGINYFIRGKGYFNSRWIYQESAYPNAFLPYNFDAFINNPANLRIGAFDVEKGIIKYWSKNDISCMEDIMIRIRASSSMPIIMPETIIDGRRYVDGGVQNGIPLDIAILDGYKKYFIVRTRTKEYRRKPLSKAIKSVLAARYSKDSYLYYAMVNRHRNYNDTLDEIDRLALDGCAYVIYPDEMPYDNKEKNYNNLIQLYNMGLYQGKRDLNKWCKFLGINC